MAKSPDALGPITADRYFNAASESSILEYELDNALLRIAGIDPEKPEKWPCGNIVYDSYDSSFEFWGCEDDFALTEQQWAQCRALGFSRAWLCYKDGTERYYPGGSIKTSPDGVTRLERGQVKQLKAENARLLAALRTAQQERDEALKTLDLLSGTKLIKAGAEGNDFALTLSSRLWPAIVNTLAIWFVEQGGKNYVEFKAEYDQDKKATLTSEAPSPVGPFVITMQRLEGKSPNDLRLEAEAQLTAALAAKEQAEQALAKQIEIADAHFRARAEEMVAKDLTERQLNSVKRAHVTFIEAATRAYNGQLFKMCGRCATEYNALMAVLDGLVMVKPSDPTPTQETTT